MLPLRVGYGHVSEQQRRVLPEDGVLHIEHGMSAPGGIQALRVNLRRVDGWHVHRNRERRHVTACRRDPSDGPTDTQRLVVRVRGNDEHAGRAAGHSELNPGFRTIVASARTPNPVDPNVRSASWIVHTMARP
jgi:hypothetical protein